jgi:large subunit ribosomal protein L25
MADQITLTTEPRQGAGKGEARALRRQGRVPAVAYGVGLDAMSFSVDERELRHALATDAGENAVITLQIDGQPHLTMPREIHRHPVRRSVLHLDFVAIRRDVKVTVEVPLHVVGEVEGDAVVSQALNGVNVEVLPLEVPDAIEVDVTGREIGDVIRLGDLDLPEGVALLDDPEETAVSITPPDVGAGADEDAAADATEVAATAEVADEAGTDPADADAAADA